jgi:hypothetical protein
MKECARQKARNGIFRSKSMMTATRHASVAMALCILCTPTGFLAPLRSLAAAAAELPDPLSILANRSPGERSHGVLASTKPGRRELPGQPPGGSGKPPFVPHERVLPQIRTRPPGSGGPPIPDVVPTVSGGGGFVPEIFVGQTITPGFIEIPPWGSVGPPGMILPPILGGSPGGPLPPPAPPPPPAVSSLPEPTTWATAIPGLCLIGGLLRRHRAATARVEREGWLSR